MEQERWVHPVTGASEVGSRVWAVWRFRLLLLVVMALLGLAVLWIFSLVRGTDSPTSPGAQRPAVVLSAPR